MSAQARANCDLGESKCLTEAYHSYLWKRWEDWNFDPVCTGRCVCEEPPRAEEPVPPERDVAYHCPLCHRDAQAHELCMVTKFFHGDSFWLPSICADCQPESCPAVCDKMELVQCPICKQEVYLGSLCPLTGNTHEQILAEEKAGKGTARWASRKIMYENMPLICPSFPRIHYHYFTDFEIEVSNACVDWDKYNTAYLYP